MTAPEYTPLSDWLGYTNHGIASVKTYVLGFVMKVSVMEEETRRDELVRLRKAQLKALQDEVYGGMSLAEQAEYNRRTDRIHELTEGVDKMP